MSAVGKLDEISAAIGEMREGIRSIRDQAGRDRKAADERHNENTQKLETISRRVGDVERTVAPLAETVANMKPIVDGVQMTRWQITGALLAGGGLLSAIAWAISHFGGELLKALSRKWGGP